MDPRYQNYTSGPDGIFKHKYMIQPTITATDALMQAGGDICNPLANISPEIDKTQRVINFLLYLFKGQAKKNESGTDTQRVCMEVVQAQRVVVEEAEQTIGAPLEEMMMENDDLRTTRKLEVYYPSNDATTNNGVLEIIIKEKITLANNTRASIR